MKRKGHAASRLARLAGRHIDRREPSVYRCGVGWAWIEQAQDRTRAEAARRRISSAGGRSW